MNDDFDSQVTEAVTVGIRHIGIATYSSGKIYKYLMNKGYTSEICSAAVSRIIQRGYIDDIRAGNKVLRVRQGRKQESSSMLSKRLYADGICKDAIDTLLSTLPSDRELLYSLLESTYTSIPNLDNYEDFILELMKLAHKKGFSSELSSSVIRDWLNDFTN